MVNRLITLLHGRPVGVVANDNGRLTFTYDEDWRADPDAFPLSISLPLTAAEHGHGPIEAYIWGLLPDNDRILAAWARRYQVSAQNVFDLMAVVGEDCAGAVQFLTPERVDAMLNDPDASGVDWMTEEDLTHRLQTLVADQAAWRLEGDRGQFTLSGVLPKTALVFDGVRWGVPRGSVPTTHILKPPTGDWEGYAENEHFCLTLARAAGITVPGSWVLHSGGQAAIALERYDRVSTDEGWIRLHQEDICQAVGLHPAGRYEANGGPGVTRIARLIRDYCENPEADLIRFVEAIAFNWLIGGIERHAKNYSLLIGPRGAVRLAPLYDPASILPYRQVDQRNVKLAMQIGGEYSLRYIGMRNWQKLAGEVDIDDEFLVDRIRDMADSLFEHALSIEQDLETSGSAHPTLRGLAGGLKARAAACRRLMQ